MSSKVQALAVMLQKWPHRCIEVLSTEAWHMLCCNAAVLVDEKGVDETSSRRKKSGRTRYQSS